MLQNKPTPVVAPLIALLRSRKTMVTLLGALISLLVPFAPGLEAQRENLLTVGLILSGLLAAMLTHSIGMEDAAAKSAPTTLNIPTAGDTTISQPAAPPADESDTQPLNPFSSKPRG